MDEKCYTCGTKITINLRVVIINLLPRLLCEACAEKHKEEEANRFKQALLNLW